MGPCFPALNLVLLEVSRRVTDMQQCLLGWTNSEMYLTSWNYILTSAIRSGTLQSCGTQKQRPGLPVGFHEAQVYH